jgi:hypothetical protein
MTGARPNAHSRPLILVLSVVPEDSAGYQWCGRDLRAAYRFGVRSLDWHRTKGTCFVPQRNE